MHVTILKYILRYQYRSLCINVDTDKKGRTLIGIGGMLFSFNQLSPEER